MAGGKYYINGVPKYQLRFVDRKNLKRQHEHNEQCNHNHSAHTRAHNQTEDIIPSEEFRLSLSLIDRKNTSISYLSSWEDDVFCAICGSNNCLGYCDIEVEPSRCSFCFNYESECTCNQGCSYCGSQWCSGDCQIDYCSDCGGAWCYGNCMYSCSYCGDSWCPGNCWSFCLECGSSYCSGQCRESEGNGSNTPNADPLYATGSTLTPAQKQELEKALVELLKNPSFKKIYDMFKNGQIKINFHINSSMAASGQYTVSNNSISFKDISCIVYPVFREEFVHAFQNNFLYPGQMSNNMYRFNIELEAHLFVDAALALEKGKFYALDSNTIGFNGTTELRNAVEVLMNAMLINGGFSESHMSLYHDVANKWTQYPGSYINTFRPEAMLQYLQKK